jgi:hypothetical protein
MTIRIARFGKNRAIARVNFVGCYAVRGLAY